MESDSWKRKHQTQAPCRSCTRVATDPSFLVACKFSPSSPSKLVRCFPSRFSSLCIAYQTQKKTSELSSLSLSKLIISGVKNFEFRSQLSLESIRPSDRVSASAMAQARSASALFLRRCSFLAADCIASPVKRIRGLASLSANERTTGSNERPPGWRVRAGVIGGGAAVTGFMSLLEPAVSCSEGVQQSAETLVVTETLDASKDNPRNLSTDTVAQLLAELRAICDEDQVIVDVEERELHAKPWNTYHSVDAIPDIVVHPKSQEEVVAIVKACAKLKVPVTPFAGGTSLEGHTLTLQKGVSINMNSMKKVKELHLEDMDVIVEPGIGWIELNEYLKPYGLFFPLDPGPGATIGGMCATRCSGSMAVRYGTIRDNVISLKAVVANGDVVKTAARARKSAAGYDLTRLLIGSEGTLGVITEVTLRLQKIPEATVVAVCNFKTVGDAAAVAIATMHSGIQVSRVEMLDEVMMKAINLANDKSYPEEATLMFELIGTEAYTLEQTARVKKIVEEHDGSDFVFANTPMEKEELWKIRKEAFWSTFVLRPGAEAMVTDVCVPLSRLAECISSTKTKLLASSLPNTLLAHAGDGNFHAIILFDPKNKKEVDEALELSNEMVHASLSMEGTCTGEHGIGVGKIKYLEKELGPEAMTMMGTIKRALDPNNLMNPGKIIPEKFCY